MQPITKNGIFQNRERAGLLLSQNLLAYKDANAIVVGIPRGGVCVAYTVARTLGLPMEVMPSLRIKDPVRGNEYIGSVCKDEVYLRDCARSIPQDYLLHQIALNRSVARRETEGYYGQGEPRSFRSRNVILVDDFLNSGITMMACLRSIRKQQPLKIVVAVPVVTTEAARIVSAEADEVLFLRVHKSPFSPSTCFAEFPTVTNQQVKTLMNSLTDRLARRLKCAPAPRLLTAPNLAPV